MPLAPAHSSLYRERTRAWGAWYAARFQVVGATMHIVNFGDQQVAGKISASTFTAPAWSASGISAVWTPSAALSALATAVDLTAESSWLGDAPIAKLNGTSERLTTPDAAYWTAALTALSICGWVNMVDSTSSTIMAKFTTVGDLREWRLDMTASDFLRLILSDENDAVTPNATIDTTANAAFPQGRWVFFAATYDGTANATGIDLYQDGVVVASTDTDDVNFASSRNTTSIVEIGAAEAAVYFDGSLLGGPCGLTISQTQLTAAQVLNLYNIDRHYLGV